MSHNAITTCSGLCAHCTSQHHLATGGAAKARAITLMEELTSKEVVDVFSSLPNLSTDSLFGEARGKMFGVLECDNRGTTVFLYAFSGQFCGLWDIEGWAPPLFDTEAWATTNAFNTMRIKRLTAHIENCLNNNTPENIIKTLKKRRKTLSQDLMQQIHNLYAVHSHSGTPRKLGEAFLFPDKIPTGTGDCCAPKLLNMAHMHGYKPVSIAEFFFGRTNKSGTKQHGQFYSSCISKCAPLLGYMLCPLQ